MRNKNKKLHMSLDFVELLHCSQFLNEIHIVEIEHLDTYK